MTDYFGFLALKALGPLFRALPPECVLFIGRRLGDLVYSLDRRHRALAYANLKKAVGRDYSPKGLRSIVRNFYRSFAQNLIEMFLIPRVDKAYIEKYIEIEGLSNIAAAFKKGKGVLLVGVHAGSWELSNVISSNLEFPFYVLVRDQRYPRLEKLLNQYRQKKGCKLIQRKEQTRELIRVLKNNGSVGLTADQGGRTGTTVRFFGREASMASGAIRLALKYDAAILPCYYIRKKGPYIKVVVCPALEMARSADKEQELKDSLQRLIAVFEVYIRQYPHEYLWTYKIWKYSGERKILILNDGRTGHLRQSQAVAGLARECFAEKGISSEVETIDAAVTGKAGFFLALRARLGLKAGDRLKDIFPDSLYKKLAGSQPDVIISCGNGVAAVNRILSLEFKSRSIVIMQPALLGIKGFDLALIPLHDRPVRAPNVVVTEGALNLISPEYLKDQSRKLCSEIGIDSESAVGFLIGGDSKGFKLAPELIAKSISGIKPALEALNIYLLLTTSRRTPEAVEKLVREAFSGYPRCKYMVIASEDNPAHAVGGILGLSRVIITTAESISMISEAVTSGRYCIALDAPGLSRRHRNFLDLYQSRGYLSLVKPEALEETIRGIWSKGPQVNILNDKTHVKKALARIL